MSSDISDQSSSYNSYTPDSGNNSELKSDLKKTVKGTSILFIGTIIYTLFGMLCTIIVARYYSVGEYGIYGLAIFLRFDNLLD